MNHTTSYPETRGWPQPTLTELNREFWEAARRNELRIQQCDNCRHLRFPIAPTCPNCLSNDATWHTVTGRGEVFARIIYRRAFGKQFADSVPYVVAIIQLDEGPRMVSNVVGSPPETVEVGARVEVVFDTPAAEEPHHSGQPDALWAVPRFRLSDNDSGADGLSDDVDGEELQ